MTEFPAWIKELIRVYKTSHPVWVQCLETNPVVWAPHIPYGTKSELRCCEFRLSHPIHLKGASSALESGINER